MRTRGISGSFEPQAALHRLLEGTGLEYRLIDNRTIAILEKTAGSGSESSPQRASLQFASSEVDQSSGRLRQVAQAETQTVQQQAQVDEDDDGLELEEIVVTGSRIRRSEYTTTQPLISVDSEISFKRGFDNVAQALNEMPSFGVPQSDNFGTQGGLRNSDSNPVGQQFVNFFGLGAQRTLTVIDGKRVVSQASPSFNNAGQQVDLNIIPKGLIERVETLMIGGSPIYGSDAVAGTVNVILKDDFEGGMIDARGGDHRPRRRV